MNDFTPASALIGGVLIGIAASLLLLTHGRVAGVSGLFGDLVRLRPDDRGYRWSFLLGLVVTGLVVRIAFPSLLASRWTASLPAALVAGVIVGFGTQLGSGCTSGHGVCGTSRLAPRSIVATLTFIATGAVTVFVLRHVLRGAP